MGKGNQAVCKKAIKTGNFENVYAVKIVDKRELKADANSHSVIIAID